MNEHPDFLDEIVADDPSNRRLAAELRSWRSRHGRQTVQPDGRLEARFSEQAPVEQPASWRTWMQRPSFAFAASFAAVLILGAGAFAMVARNSSPETVAAPTSVAALAEADDQPGEIVLPGDLSEQTGYASCVFSEMKAWFTGGFAAEDAPDLSATCGTLPIPDLGPEAEAFRQDLQAFVNCVTGELNSVLPELPGLVGEGHDGLGDLENKCGEPPDPRDYGLVLPFADFDWENFDPSQLNFGGFNFGDFNLDEFDFEGFNLEDFDLDEFLENLPEGLLPEDFDLEQWKSNFGDFDLEGFEFDLEACDPEDFPALEDIENFDFKTFFEEFDGGRICGFTGFFGPEGLDLEGLDLESLDLDQLLSDLDGQFGGFDLEGLEDLNLQELLDKLMADGGFDFEGFFGDGEFDLSKLFEQPAEANA